jgi:hypothetical protein
MNLKAFGWSRLEDMGEVLIEEPREEPRAPGVPDFVAGDPEKEPEDGWDAFGWRHEGGKLVSEPRQLIRLENCSVLRTSLGRERWHIVGPSGDVCGVESYHDGRWISRHIGETVSGSFENGASVSMNLMDDAPIDATVEDPHVLIGHFWDRNFCNMLFETASRFWFHDSTWRLEHLPVVWETKAPWMRELAGWLCPDKATPLRANHVRFKTLFVPSFYSQLSPPSRDAIGWLRKRYSAPSETGGRRFYMTRNDADSRRIVNEAEVIAMLAPLGFEPVSMTGMSLESQKRMFRDVGTVVAPHGAGCSNLIFSGPDARLLELVPRGYQHHAFHYLATWGGQWYGRIVCDDDANHDMRVDLDMLRAGLDAAL